jgi:predicted dehydrogenase
VGCHALDILFHIFGYPKRVSGMKTNLAGLYVPEDTVGATLMLPNKIMVNGSWSFIAPETLRKDRVEVMGEHGRMEFSVFSFDPIRLVQGENRETISIIQPEHIQMPLIQTIVSELNGEGTCPSTGNTAAITSRVMDEILSDEE